MFLVQDIRQSRVYQEAWQEGRDEAITSMVATMATKKMPAEEIADILNLDVDRVRQELAKATRN